jgi:hypothetical protein
MCLKRGPKIPVAYVVIVQKPIAYFGRKGLKISWVEIVSAEDRIVIDFHVVAETV